MLTVEQVLATNKANIDTLMGLSSKAFEGAEKILELNLSTTKTALATSGENTKSLLNAKDAQELIALQSRLLQPLAEKTAAYSRHLFEIATGASADFGKTLGGQAAQVQRSILGLVDSATQNAPAGSETAVALVKSAVTAATHALESVQKVVTHASETAETHFKASTANASSTTDDEKLALKKR